MMAARTRLFFDAGLKQFLRYNSTESVKPLTVPVKPKRSTVDVKDVERHGKLSTNWWDVHGNSRALHSMNPLRVQFVRDGLANVGYKELNPTQPLEGVKILDVGCGGGILAEPLARIGADVTGIDASKEQIKAAKDHAALDTKLAEKLTYVHTTVEEMAHTEPGKYDAVLASEIVEHVFDKDLFLKSCIDTLKPGGSIFVTTMNRTFQSWLGGIIAAEYVLKLLPAGTHDWNKFVTPDETRRLLQSRGCKTNLVHGMFYNPLSNEWSWTASTAINYAIHAIKEGKSTV